MGRKAMFARYVCLVLVSVLSAFGSVLAASPQQVFGYIFTPIDVPGATGTEACGINTAGQVAGAYTDARGMIHAFLLDRGTFTTFDVPGAAATAGCGVNAGGQVVGGYTDAGGTSHGFLLDKGVFSTIDPPGAGLPFTFAQGINSVGQIVGAYVDSVATHGFLFDRGAFTKIDAFGSVFTEALGISADGRIVGHYACPNDLCGFLLDKGVLTTFAVPGARGTRGFGINQAGQIVGDYFDASGIGHGFLLDNGTFATIDFPRAVTTLPTGINSAGQIVGEYTDTTGMLHGFVATSQTEPSQIASRCDGPGPFALRINPDLLRDDLRVEPMDELPRSAIVRTPGQERQARRGVCQDPRTGLTVFEHEVSLQTLKELPDEDGSTGGDEGFAPAPAEFAGTGAQPLPKIVIGPDQRIIQSPATSFPFRAVVKLIMTYQNDPNSPKKTFGCTGSFIGGFHILTAGHCVFKQASGAFPNIFGWADSVLVIPGFDGGSVPNKPFGQAFVTKPLRSFKSWTSDGDTEGDIGLITLNQTFTVGSFGLFYPSDNTLDATNAQLIGYPGDMGSPPGTQEAFVPGGGAITDYESEIVFYQIDTFKGQSGSGVYRFWNNKRSIFAVHHGGCSSQNCGARITKYRHDTIRGWQCSDGQAISGVCP